MRRITRWVLICTFWAAGMVGLGPQKAQAETNANLELQLGARFDNNAALGRRGLFGADAVIDVTSIFGAKADISHELGKKKLVKVLLGSTIKIEELRLRNFLRNSELELQPGLELKLGQRGMLRLQTRVKMHREEEKLWGYVEASPTILFQYFTKMGLVLELGYDFTATLYDSEELTNTYANVDRLDHLAKARLKLWQTKKIRHQLRVEFQHVTYDKNIEERLAEISFLEDISQFENPDVVIDHGDLGLDCSDPAVICPIERKDKMLRVEYEFLGVAHKYLAIAVAYRFELNESNLDPFKNIAHGPRLGVAFRYEKGKLMHEAFLEGKVGLYDYRRFRFDTRFTSTKKDVRLEGFAAYILTLEKVWKFGLRVSFISNFSNDFANFVPAHSLSFSRYQGLRAELMVSYTWSTTKSGEKQKTPQPRIPGTILAKR